MLALYDITMLTFSCVAANHLGLVAAIEGVIRHPLPIVNCPKCLTFWAVLGYGLWFVGFSDVPTILAAAFLSAWSAIWLDLLMGFIDKLYLKLYEQIYPTATSADTDTLSAPDPMPNLHDEQD